MRPSRSESARNDRRCYRLPRHVAHVFAPDTRSALFVQGYETAKARFWQLDAFRRVAEGRLTKLFGIITLAMDVEMRTAFTTREGRRLQDVLWEDLQASDASAAAQAEAYAAGINAWIADARAGRNGATLPPEYSTVGLDLSALEDWRPQDTLAIGRLQAFFLSASLGEEVGNAEIYASLPDALRRDIYRSAPGAPATTIPVNTTNRAQQLGAPTQDLHAATRDVARRALDVRSSVRRQPARPWRRRRQ